METISSIRFSFTRKGELRAELTLTGADGVRSYPRIVNAAALIAAATALTFAALGVHIAQGGAFELRTVAAMALRTTVWAVLAWLAFRHLGRQHSPNLLSE